jgi:hypothetical protein
VERRQLSEQYRKLDRAALSNPVQFSANLLADFAKVRERMTGPAAAGQTGGMWRAH